MSVPSDLYRKAAAKLFGVLELDVTYTQLKKTREAVAMQQRGVPLATIKQELKIKPAKPKATPTGPRPVRVKEPSLDDLWNNPG